MFRLVVLAVSCACNSRAGDSAGERRDPQIVACVPAAQQLSFDSCSLSESRTDAVLIENLDERLLRNLKALAPDDIAWSRAFRVTVLPNGDSVAKHASQLPPVIGRYEVVEGALQFTPRFEFAEGTSYVVEGDIAELSKLAGLLLKPQPMLRAHFAIPKTATARTTRVVGVYPGSSELPENLLRWYIEFSAPMRSGEALEHIHLKDASGREVHNAFLKLGQELWDSSRTRLTVLLDPGRVKRGIRTNLEMGRPLVAGRRYTLSVDADWQDGAGAELMSGFNLRFSTGTADRKSPAVTNWALDEPEVGTRGPVQVHFGESLDHAQALRMLSIETPRGERVAGDAQLSRGDSVWSFIPKMRWDTALYVLRSMPQLEDVAGNSLRRLYDEDVDKLGAVDSSHAFNAIVELRTFRAHRDTGVPAGSNAHVMTTAGATGGVLLFGGGVDSLWLRRGDTRTWDGLVWTRVDTAGPPGVGHHAMAFDSRRGRVVLFGGDGPNRPANDEVWEWEGTRRTQRSRTGHVPGGSQ